MTTAPPPDEEAFHLLQCLIYTAMADSVLHEAETDVLEQAARALGQVDVETWERAWSSWRGGVALEAVLSDIPQDPRLRRFILREMVSLSFADGELAAPERALLVTTADAFGLADELDDFIDWGHRAMAIYLEGEALLTEPSPI